MVFFEEEEKMFISAKKFASEDEMKVIKKHLATISKKKKFNAYLEIATKEETEGNLDEASKYYLQSWELFPNKRVDVGLLALKTILVLNDKEQALVVIDKLEKSDDPTVLMKLKQPNNRF